VKGNVNKFFQLIDAKAKLLYRFKSKLYQKPFHFKSQWIAKREVMFTWEVLEFVMGKPKGQIPLSCVTQ